MAALVEGKSAATSRNGTEPQAVLGPEAKKAYGGKGQLQSKLIMERKRYVMNANYSTENRGLEFMTSAERRVGIRFPIEMDVNCRVGGRTPVWIQGKTINISSSGILIRSENQPASGTKVLLALAWPKLLDNRVPLRLMVQGHVVRANDGQVAVMVQRFEFRTAGSGAQS